VYHATGIMLIHSDTRMSMLSD